MKRRRAGECAYCGRTGPLTFDHIPPKNLFGHPRPGNLVTVPCCQPCNQAASQDDEYFRLALVVRADLGDNPAARAAWESAMRGLQKPGREGFRKGFLRTVRFHEARTPAGLYVGQAGSFEPDLARLDAVAVRIVRGLYFHHRRQRVPADAEVRSWCVAGIDASSRDAIEDVRTFAAALTKAKPITRGDGVFSYWHQFVEDNQVASAWLLRFFERAHFLVLVVPTSLLTPDKHSTSDPADTSGSV